MNLFPAGIIRSVGVIAIGMCSSAIVCVDRVFISTVTEPYAPSTLDTIIANNVDAVPSAIEP